MHKRQILGQKLRNQENTALQTLNKIPRPLRKTQIPTTHAGSNPTIKTPLSRQKQTIHRGPLTTTQTRPLRPTQPSPTPLKRLPTPTQKHPYQRPSLPHLRRITSTRHPETQRRRLQPHLSHRIPAKLHSESYSGC